VSGGLGRILRTGAPAEIVEMKKSQIINNNNNNARRERQGGHATSS
jgi:hypothetical protein